MVVVVFVFKINYFGNAIRVSKVSVPYQARRFVGPDLSQICFQGNQQTILLAKS